MKSNLHNTNKGMFYFGSVANGDLSASTNDKALHKYNPAVGIINVK